MTTTRHSEAAFESVIEAHLLDNGYVTLKSGFDPKRAIFPQMVTVSSNVPSQKNGPDLRPCTANTPPPKS